MWKLGLVQGLESIEALAGTRLEVCGSFDADVDIPYLLV
jgi:hypothetical protein